MKILGYTASFLLWGRTHSAAATAIALNRANQIMIDDERLLTSLPNLGGCPPPFSVTGLYEEGDRVSINNSIVVECTSWPQSMYCSQTGFEPSLTSKDNHWKHAWQVVGNCNNASAATFLPSCGDQVKEWAYGNHNNYQENDKVIVEKTSDTFPPKQVHTLYTCKPWPNSNFCAMFNPVDTAGGHLGWRFGGDCNATLSALNSVTAGCPRDYNPADGSTYTAGSEVSKSVATTSTPLQKVAYRCREWPNSLYCNNDVFVPDGQYGSMVWIRLGPCEGTIRPTTQVSTSIAPTYSPTSMT